MKRYLFVVFGLTSLLYSAAPTCYSGGYCRYEGIVDRVYVNASNKILVYFDTPLNVSIAKNIGLNPTHGSAGIVDANENKIFADYFYSTVLSAQASNRKILVQMGSVKSGYLKIDRIWLSSK